MQENLQTRCNEIKLGLQKDYLLRFKESANHIVTFSHNIHLFSSLYHKEINCLATMPDKI